MATGPNFQDVTNLRFMCKIGNPGESGMVEVTDLMSETLDPAPGCIMIEWNIAQTSPGVAGMWKLTIESVALLEQIRSLRSAQRTRRSKLSLEILG
jgi:hypothetical protein